MPLPANWTLVTLTGKFTEWDGTPCTGSIMFECEQHAVIGNTIIVPKFISGTLDASGNLSVQLPSTNDPDLAPQGLAYKVTERIRNGRDPYWIRIPYTVATLDLSTIAPVSAPTLSQLPPGPLVNYIGVPGQLGFGLGICPTPPAGFTEMEGTQIPASANYGNYRYSDGSIMCWIPAFYYRIGHAGNPTYGVHGVNSFDVQSYGAFPTVADANTAGYALHRAFYDGTQQLGFFVDKYQCSNNAGTASSLPLKPPLSTAADHNPLSGLTGAPVNAYYGTIAAAKTRGVQFFPTMLYQRSALAMLSMAHGQAASATTYCAWYSAGTTNFPKGNNNNAFSDTNDASVTFTHDGYATGNSALTGSGVPLAKTTHNGQSSGVADLNGNMYDVALGLTAITTAKGITAATQTNPVQITAATHGFSANDVISIAGVVGMTELNSRMFKVGVIDANTLSLIGVDGTAFAAYTSGGAATAQITYALNTASRAKDLTAGATLATDQWGATGVAAHSAAIAAVWRTDYPNNGYGLRCGNAAEQFLSAQVAGSGWTRTGYGMTSNVLGASPSGTTLFGQDYYYQSHTNLLCPIAGLYWSPTSLAGVWAVSFNYSRTGAYNFVGFRAASYL